MEILPDANDLKIKIAQKYVDEIIKSASNGSTYLSVPKMLLKYINFYNLGYKIFKSNNYKHIVIYWGCFDKLKKTKLYKKAKLNKLNNYNKPQYMITVPCVETIQKLMFNSFIKKIKKRSDNMISSIYVKEDAYYIYKKYCDFDSKKYNIIIDKDYVTIRWDI
jgi:hypothetical protein